MKTPRIVFAATSSGCGKTTIVTGILASLKKRGFKIQSYKIGPDYIDPGFHSRASGSPAHNLDSWLVPAEKLREIFFETSRGSDLAIIEGVMGLFDGGSNGISSTAEIAKLLDSPVILILDVKSQGSSAAATALGFREFDKDLKIAGVILNRVGSENHQRMIEESLEKLGIESLGAMKRDESLKLPERHLGLLPTTESQKLDESIEKIARAVESQLDLDRILEVARFEKHPRIAIARDEKMKNGYCSIQPTSTRKPKIAIARDEKMENGYCSIQPTSTRKPKIAIARDEKMKNGYCSIQSTSTRKPKIAIARDEKMKNGYCSIQSTSTRKPKIAIARDEVFSFYYPESLAVLEDFGAELIYFSPLHDEFLPECDGLIIGGGFPEMFAKDLEANFTMRSSILGAATKSLPILAECGGFMYLSKSIRDFEGKIFEMCGVFDSRVEMESKLQTVGYVEARLNRDCILGSAGEVFHAHEFHFSCEIESSKDSIFDCVKIRNAQKYSAGRIFKNSIGSYLHFHFAGAGSMAQNFVEACRRHM